MVVMLWHDLYISDFHFVVLNRLQRVNLRDYGLIGFRQLSSLTIGITACYPCRFGPSFCLR